METERKGRQELTALRDKLQAACDAIQHTNTMHAAHEHELMQQTGQYSALAY
jgi:hypothetical protein